MNETNFAQFITESEYAKVANAHKSQPLKAGEKKTEVVE